MRVIQIMAIITTGHSTTWQPTTTTVTTLICMATTAATTETTFMRTRAVDERQASVFISHVV